LTIVVVISISLNKSPKVNPKSELSANLAINSRARSPFRVGVAIRVLLAPQETATPEVEAIKEIEPSKLNNFFH
jgi:hypothetical protein